MFRKVIALVPEDAMGHYYLARILAETDRPDEAEKELKKALESRPSFEPAAVDLGLLYLKQKKNDLAIDVYRNFIRSYPTAVKVRIRLLEILLKEKRYDEADSELQGVLSRQPANQELLMTMGLMYLDAERHERAVELFGKFLETNPEDQRVRFLLASAFEAGKRHREALDAFERITPASEFYVDARVHMGIMLKNEKKTDEAIRSLKTAIAQKKQAGDYLYILLAALHEEEKDIPEAERVLQAGLADMPKSRDLLYSLGVLYEKTDRFDEAIRQMRRIVELDPDYADALNFIGYSYADRGIHLAEAEALIQKALKLKPGNAYITDSLGWVYFKQNRMDEAVKYLQEAARLMPEDPAIMEHLADAYAATGRVQEALDIYRKTLERNPGKDTLQQKISDLLKQGGR